MPESAQPERAQPKRAQPSNRDNQAAPRDESPQSEAPRGDNGRGPDRRQSVVDRRLDDTGLERRRGPGRRRSDFMKAAEEGEMSEEQFLFLKAIDAYKRVNQRPYPTWTEVLEVIRKLGYRKTTSMTLSLPAVEDWTEDPDAPAFSEAGGDSDDDPNETAAGNGDGESRG